MLNLSDHFDVLLQKIEPDGERAEFARDIPALVRDYLQQHEDIETVEPYSRLAGSYARCTAIKDIKDVDLLLTLDRSYRKKEPEEVLEKVFSVLGGLPEALGSSSKPVIRRRQRRSINVHVDEHDFDLDIVPAVVDRGIDKPLAIPDRDWSRWVETHPLGYADKLSELNGKHQDKVVPLIKLVKHWRDVQMCYRRPKSYWLECLVYHLIDNGKVATKRRSYAELFQLVLASIAQDFRQDLEMEGKVPEILDPMLGNNVAHNWERAAFETFMHRIDESLGWAERAIAEDDEEKAVELWQKVFGEEWFPTEVEAQKAMRLRADALAGAVFVTSEGRVVTGKQERPAIQVPPQRFYGEP
jgi:hypothetical protein